MITTAASSSRNRAAPALAVAIILLFLGCGVAVLGRANLDMDEARYANFAWTHLREGKWEYGLHSSQTRAATQGARRYIWADLNRLYVGSLSALFRWTGPVPEAAQAFSLVCAATLLAGAWVLGRALGGPWAGCGLVAALAVWPRFFAAAVLGRPEAMLGAVVVWGFVFLAGEGSIRAAVAGLLAGLAPGVHLNGLAGIAGQAAWLLAARPSRKSLTAWAGGLLVGLALVWPGTLSHWHDVVSGGAVKPPTSGELSTMSTLLGRAMHWVHSEDYPTTWLSYGRRSSTEVWVGVGWVWLLLIRDARRAYRPALAATLAVFLFFLIGVRRPYVLYAVPFGALWLLPVSGAVGQAMERITARRPRPMMAMLLAITFLGSVAWEAGKTAWSAWMMTRESPRWSRMAPKLRAVVGSADRICGPDILWFAFPDRVYRDWDEAFFGGDSPAAISSFLQREQIQVWLADQSAWVKFTQWNLWPSRKSYLRKDAIRLGRDDLALDIYRLRRDDLIP